MLFFGSKINIWQKNYFTIFTNSFTIFFTNIILLTKYWYTHKIAVLNLGNWGSLCVYLPCWALNWMLHVIIVCLISKNIHLLLDEDYFTCTDFLKRKINTDSESSGELSIYFWPLCSKFKEVILHCLSISSSYIIWISVIFFDFLH